LDLFTGILGANFKYSFLSACILVTITYYLNGKVLQKYINMSGDKIFIYIINIAEVFIFVIISGMVIRLARDGEIDFPAVFKAGRDAVIVLTILFSMFYAILKAKTKAMNKKLREYNNQDNQNNQNESRIEMLCEFAGYSADEKHRKNINYEYELGEKEKYKKIIKKYGLDDIAAGKKDVDLILALSKWSSDIFPGGENRVFPARRNANTIIKSGRRNGGHITGHLRCILLAEILRAYGIKAYHVLCRQFEEPSRNYLALVHAYSEDLNKWIAIEPFMYCYFKDKNNNFISIPEFRNMLINGEEILMNSDAKTLYENNKVFTPGEYFERIQQYMFRFTRTEKNYYGSDAGSKNNNTINLIPEKYLKYAQNFSAREKQNFILSERDFWGG